MKTQDFNFKINIDCLSAARDSKRQILSKSSSIFDPLGFIAPVILIPKLLMQRMWTEETPWDEQPSDAVKVQWVRWCQQLDQLEAIRIPRNLHLPFRQPTGETYHIFLDASVVGFGAVVYKRTTYEDGAIHVAFIIGKARVAPVKFVSIPRKELQGAVVGLRLATEALQELDVTVKCNQDCTFWTDSTLVLQWLRSKKRRFSIFVENRVGEILEGSNIEQWRHVPGRWNPADEVSRGLQPEEFVRDGVWTRGPDFLWKSEADWPKDIELPSEKDEDLEVVLSVKMLNIFQDRVKQRPRDGYVLDKLCERYSSTTKVIRCVAWIKRLMQHLSGRAKARKAGLPSDEQRGPMSLSASELQAAEIDCARLVQQRWYAVERAELLSTGQVSAKSKIVTLSPMISDKLVIRVGGRLDAGILPRGLKHPILLHPDAPWTRRLLLDTHGKFHVGPEQMIAAFRHRYWVPQARRVARDLTRSCIGCRKLFSKPVVPRMADLPAKRIVPFMPAFYHTGVDVFGPITVTVGRRSAKRWICLFTCFNTRAVHLEVLFAMSTDSFLMALERFFSCTARHIRSRVTMAEISWAERGRSTQRSIRTRCRRTQLTKVSLGVSSLQLLHTTGVCGSALSSTRSLPSRTC